MRKKQKVLQNLEELSAFLRETENVVIYGAGDYGKKIIDYLIFAGEERKIRGIVVTKRKHSDRCYRKVKIQEASDFFEKNKNCFVLIAASLEHWFAIEEIVCAQEVSYRIMAQELYIDICRKMDTREREIFHGIDFILAGFEKCGTTSLYAALKKMPSIYLSDEKESHYFSWFDTMDDAREKLIEIYFDNIKKGQIVGMIEPTFWLYAKEVFVEFGPNVKLIFLVRNPVDAVFSYFKMANRLGHGELLGAYQKAGGKFHLSIFEEYFSRLIQQKPYMFQYDYWIAEFLKLFPEDQIKILFFEELIQKPSLKLKEI